MRRAETAASSQRQTTTERVASVCGGAGARSAVYSGIDYRAPHTETGEEHCDATLPAHCSGASVAVEGHNT